MNERELKDAFVWFQGAVEDRNDPLKLGRCRVRIVGWHDGMDEYESPKTEDLPWAHPIQPITSAAMSGIGQTPLGPVEGTWVFGFFRDGHSAQQPVIMGTLGGIPQEHKQNVPSGPPYTGKRIKYPKFGDPRGTTSPESPYGTYPRQEYMGEPDTNRLARNENINDTIMKDKLNDQDAMYSATGIGDPDIISEPDVPYNASYPFNHVYESESGHIIEIDDTEGAERINIHHKSGTFIEIHPDGSMVRKVAGKGYEVIVDDDSVHVKGNYNIAVDGDASIYTKGDSRTRTDGDHTVEVVGDYELNVGGMVRVAAGQGSSHLQMDSSAIRLVNGTGIHLN